MKVSATKGESEMRRETEKAAERVIKTVFGDGLRDRFGNVRSVYLTPTGEGTDRTIILNLHDGSPRIAVTTVSRLFGGLDQ